MEARRRASSQPALTIQTNNEQEDDEALNSSMEITTGGSIYYRGYKIGRQVIRG